MLDTLISFCQEHCPEIIRDTLVPLPPPPPTVIEQASQFMIDHIHEVAALGAACTGMGIVMFYLRHYPKLISHTLLIKAVESNNFEAVRILVGLGAPVDFPYYRAELYVHDVLLFYPFSFDAPVALALSNKNRQITEYLIEHSALERFVFNKKDFKNWVLHDTLVKAVDANNINEVQRLVNSGVPVNYPHHLLPPIPISEWYLQSPPLLHALNNNNAEMADYLTRKNANIGSSWREELISNFELAKKYFILRAKTETLSDRDLDDFQNHLSLPEKDRNVFLSIMAKHAKDDNAKKTILGKAAKHELKELTSRLKTKWPTIANQVVIDGIWGHQSADSISFVAKMIDNNELKSIFDAQCARANHPAQWLQLSRALCKLGLRDIILELMKKWPLLENGLVAKYLSEGDRDFAIKLIEAGADVDSCYSYEVENPNHPPTNIQTETPLHMAIKFKRLCLLEKLIEKNVVIANGSLELALEERFFEGAKLLIKAGADVSKFILKDKYDENELEIMSEVINEITTLDMYSLIRRILDEKTFESDFWAKVFAPHPTMLYYLGAEQKCPKAIKYGIAKILHILDKQQEAFELFEEIDMGFVLDGKDQAHSRYELYKDASNIMVDIVFNGFEPNEGEPKEVFKARKIALLARYLNQAGEDKDAEVIIMNAICAKGEGYVSLYKNSDTKIPTEPESEKPAAKL